MEESFATSARIDREALRGMMARRDGPGLWRLGVQLALLVGAGAATVRLGAAGSPWWAATATLGGLALLGFFPALHESGHATAFRGRAMNAAAAWLAAPLMLQAPSFFREFHWEHHRETQNRARDPEIAAAPELLDGWPRSPLHYLAIATGQGLWTGKLGFTIASALLPSAAAWAKVFPFVRPTMRRRVAWESRLVLAILGGAIAAGLAWVPGFVYALAMVPLAHLFMGLYVMPEHTGLPNEGSQLHRTRTIRSSALVRWWMWNMPYHAAHHAYPAVPFHAVPALNERLGPELEHVVPGYLAFHAEAIRRAFGGR